MEQFAQLINGIGGNAVSLPDTVVGGPAEAFFLQRDSSAIAYSHSFYRVSPSGTESIGS